MAAKNELHWSHWWYLERDAYLRLRDRVRAAQNTRAGRTVDLGTAGIPPSRAKVEAVVLPTLIDALATERADDVLTAALIAVARIGASDDGAFTGRIRTAIIPHLSASSQEVSETAVLALGIFGEPSALTSLLDIASGTAEGAKLTGRGRVPTRTQAFAAIGLGLLARELDDATARQRIALTLVEILERDHATDDLSVAATIAFGLCVLPTRLTVPEADLRSAEHVDVVLHRSSQVSWLVKRLDPAKSLGRSSGHLQRAHACIALARLATGLAESDRARALEALESRALSASESIQVRSGALIALGVLARSGDGAADVLARRATQVALKKGQPMERRFALIALASASGRPGGGDDGLASAAAARRTLLSHIQRGKSGDRTWAALALGVLAHALQDAGSDDADAAGHALANELRKQRNASNVGAYAIGCALMCERSPDALRKQAGESAMLALRRIEDPVARGHVALALGLLRYEPAREDLRTIAKTAKFQPTLLWSCAVGLGLMGDEDVTPMLVDALAGARSLSSRAAAASALGHVGDRRAVMPLIEMILDEGQSPSARAFAIVGLGVVCDEHPLPWRSSIAHALPYTALTSALSGNAKGLLEIL